MPPSRAVGPLEEQGEDQPDDAQAGEHDLARDIAPRLVPQQPVEEGEEPEADILDGRHQAEGRPHPLGADDERDRRPEGGRDEDEGESEQDHRIDRVDPGQAHGQVAGDHEERAGDHERRPLPHPVHEPAGERGQESSRRK